MPPQFQKGGIGKDNTNAKRQIPNNHEFDKKAIKPIVQTLWAMSVALGHALTAHRQFSRLKVLVVLTGRAPGRARLRDANQGDPQIFEACENLSTLVDRSPRQDQRPHWKPKLADLEKSDMSEVERLQRCRGVGREPRGRDRRGDGRPQGPCILEQGPVQEGRHNPSFGHAGRRRQGDPPKSGPTPRPPTIRTTKTIKNASEYTYNRASGVRESMTSFFERTVPIAELQLPGNKP